MGTLIDCYVSTSHYIVDLLLPLTYDVRFILIRLLQMGNGADSCNLVQIAAVRNPGSLTRALGPAASLQPGRHQGEARVLRNGALHRGWSLPRPGPSCVRLILTVYLPCAGPGLTVVGRGCWF